MVRHAVVGLVVGLLVVAATPLAIATHGETGNDEVAFWADRGGFGVDDPEAECFVDVPAGGTASCSVTWNQASGEFGGDWHTTFHPDVLFVTSSVGRLDLTIEDDTGDVIFERSCLWFGPAALTGTGGLCSRSFNAGNHSVGQAGTWTMTLTAHADAAAGQSTAHAQFGLHEQG